MNTRKRIHRLTTNSAEETKKLAADLARVLHPGDTVLLMAQLGAGKTTFVQGLVRALGVEDEALSPTFVIAQTLKGRFPIHHLDFYRLSPREILAMGIQDYLLPGGAVPHGLVLIEWAERCPELWPPSRLEVAIEIDKKTKARHFRFHAVGERYLRLIDRMKDAVTL